MDGIVQDWRFALRLLRKERAFTATVVATLALCVGANVAIFAVVNAVLLRPLPFETPAALVSVRNAYPGAGVDTALNSVPDYIDRLQGVTAFEELASYQVGGMTIGGDGAASAERVRGMDVTPSFFRVLRVPAWRGAWFTEADAEYGRHRSVIISHGLWQRLFAGRDEAIGRDVRINGVAYLVRGVMPAGFQFVDPDVQLWRPAAFTAEERADAARHSSNSWQQLGRLRDGATLEQVQQQLDALNARNLAAFPQWRELLINARFHSVAASFQDELVAGIKPTLLLLWGGVAVMLMIGCVNVVNLASVRASVRLREMAMRAAIGASVGRLARQVLTEAAILAAVGAGLGLLLGGWALDAAPLLGFDRFPRGRDIGLDTQVVLFALVLACVVGLAIGLLPVLALRRANLGQMVREEGRRSTASRGTLVTRRVLVTCQIACALVLLVGGGLLVASFARILAVDPGFVPDRVLTGSVSLPSLRYRDASAVRNAADRLLERVRALPGVEAAGVTSSVPFGGDYVDSVIVPRGRQVMPGEMLISPYRVVASDGYFEAMQIDIVDGRAFDARDGRAGAGTVIVDETVARAFWPNERAIGRQVFKPESPDALRQPPTDDSHWLTVVGVARAVRLTGMATDPAVGHVGAYYLPYAAVPERAFTLALRTSVESSAMANIVRTTLASIDPELPFYGVRTMEERLQTSLVDRRTPMLLAVAFGVVALFLAAIGIYGVLAYQVSERRREIGIRIALGAATSSIFRMVLREGALMVAVGAAIGLLGAFLLRQTLQSQLYGIGAMDPRVVVAVAAVLLVVALVACLLPARRAARTDPVVALTE